jgi:Holliday junction resolvase RusA-like endonuclease
MASVTVSLVGLPPSANKRLHYMKRAKSNKEWKGWSHQSAVDAVNRSHDGPFPWTRVHVTLVVHYPKRTRVDLDNVTSSFKPLLDGMSGVVFKDDSSEHIHRLSAEVQVLKGEPAGVRVVVERCDETVNLPQVALDN